MEKVVGGCLGAIFGLIVGVGVAVFLVWLFGTVTDLHGSPLELIAIAVLACVVGGIVLGVKMPPSP